MFCQFLCFYTTETPMTVLAWSWNSRGRTGERDFDWEAKHRTYSNSIPRKVARFAIKSKKLDNLKLYLGETSAKEMIFSTFTDQLPGVDENNHTWWCNRQSTGTFNSWQQPLGHIMSPKQMWNEILTLQKLLGLPLNGTPVSLYDCRIVV